MSSGRDLPVPSSRKVWPRLVLTGALITTLAGCTIAGPGAIRSGRLAYNEAIRETNNQQMLLVPVHNRYEESNQLLGVASVTANVSVSSRAQFEAGLGSSDNYEGNLVPFSGGFIYEENPTISYKPVSGEAYIQQLMSPIPVSIFAQISRIPTDPAFVYSMMVSSINGIRNPAWRYDDQQDDPRFDRVVALMVSLQRQQSLEWVSESSGELGLLFRNPHSDARVNELLDLLGIEQKPSTTASLTLPVTLSLGGDTDGIGITTRSLWDLIEILSSAVAVPAEDMSSGRAASFPDPGRAGRALSIHYSDSQPEDAYVAASFRDGWFYIGDTDLETKRYFKIMGSLWSAAIAKSLGEGAASPILTVPVSR